MLVKFEESCRVIERKAGEDKREVQIILTEKGKRFTKTRDRQHRRRVISLSFR